MLFAEVPAALMVTRDEVTQVIETAVDVLAGMVAVNDLSVLGDTEFQAELEDSLDVLRSAKDASQALMVVVGIVDELVARQREALATETLRRLAVGR